MFKDRKPADLTNEDLLKTEAILQRCINEYNPGMERKLTEYIAKHPEHRQSRNNFTIELKYYKRQYVAVLNPSGEKEVWVNCFCSQGYQDWRKHLIRMGDGGNCYFNLKINLTTGQYYDMEVNGYG